MEPTGELNAAGWRYDCYMAHSWGPNKETHDKVMMIANLLKQRNIRTWVDDTNLTHYMVNDIVEGLKDSACILVFITKTYLVKAENDNSKASNEFGLAVAKGSEYMVPVILDPECLKEESWAGSRVGYHFPDHLYINFSSDERIRENFELLCATIRGMARTPKIPTLFDAEVEEELNKPLEKNGELP